eukprot:CAMPEP_0177707020 /NCGR_PEP_ID=MMETSP0484_2-20121128/9530_1 /TAXON_ID=354590 /ORGANISM="Rhodomonas lens, Strain RHODO" /LENGTH=323 /DNA_ID=CAMNT_0019218509 /DNA_START=40 /DNA_END=1008 /DNA_ORIENTATION=-
MIRRCLCAARCAGPRLALYGAGVFGFSQAVMCAPGEQREWAPYNPRDRAAQIEAEHGIVKDRRNMWRDNPHEVDADTLVVAVFGITGGGKSSTCNTMIGGRERHFQQSKSIMSITRAVSYRDYMYFRRPCRIIDTPGFSDTHRSNAEIADELDRFKAYAPHGLSAVLIVVPYGRFTQEQESALMDIRSLLGPTCVRHAIVVFTHCVNPKNRQQLLRRDELLEEVSQLPGDSTLRLLVEECSHRVVPIENVLEPAKTESRNHLHQRVLDTVDANKGAAYDVANFLKDASTRRRAQIEASGLEKLEEVPAKCHTQVFRDRATGKM